MRPKAVSLFCGCGGLDLGFHKAGFDVVLSTDKWETACKSLEKNKISRKVLVEDIRSIKFSKVLKDMGVAKVDLVFGGPPCPPYSQTRHYLTHKKNGLEDEENGFTLVEFLRAIEELRPKIFLFENVDGFSFKTNRRSFDHFKSTTRKLGYDLSFRVINAADYGVPQTRKRFFCVGFQKELSPFVFPSPTHGDPKSISQELFLKSWVTCGEVLSDLDYPLPEDKERQAGAKHKDLLREIPPGDNYLFFTKKRGHPKPLFEWKSRYWSFLLKLGKERPAWTIQASCSNNQGPFHWTNRFLRTNEIMRIQTFPDGYHLEGDFRDQWRQVGNAVPPLLAEVIGRAIAKHYFNNKRTIQRENRGRYAKP